MCVYQPNIFIKQLSELQEEIPPKNETAKKLIANILRIRPGGKRLVELEDVVIVMDGSGSVRRCEFGNGKKAMQSLMEFKDPQKDAKYAMVTFNSNVRTDFDFLPQENAAKKVGSVNFPGGSTNTQAGLARASNLFASGENDRSEQGHHFSVRHEGHLISILESMLNVCKKKNNPK